MSSWIWPGLIQEIIFDITYHQAPTNDLGIQIYLSVPTVREHTFCWHSNTDATAHSSRSLRFCRDCAWKDAFKEAGQLSSSRHNDATRAPALHLANSDQRDDGARKIPSYSWGFGTGRELSFQLLISGMYNGKQSEDPVPFLSLYESFTKVPMHMAAHIDISAHIRKCWRNIERENWRLTPCWRLRKLGKIVRQSWRDDCVWQTISVLPGEPPIWSDGSLKKKRSFVKQKSKTDPREESSRYNYLLYVSDGTI